MEVRIAEVRYCDKCPNCEDEKRPYCKELGRGVYQNQYQTDIPIPDDCPLPKKPKECEYGEHDWEYTDSGHNHAGYYWQDRKCKICGKEETEWCD
jgi:hypothetical protein